MNASGGGPFTREQSNPFKGSGAPDDRIRAPGPGPPDSTELFRTKFIEIRNEFHGERKLLK